MESNQGVRRKLPRTLLSLRRRPRLPGTSKLPLWLKFAFAMSLSQAVVLTLFFVTPSEEKVYVMPSAVVVATVLMMGFVHAISSRRITALSDVLQQDPTVVAGDPVCLQKLEHLPSVLGCSEIDDLQLAVYNTYVAYAQDTQRTRQVSSSADERPDWESVNSDVEEVDGENNLAEYLIQQEQQALLRGSRAKLYDPPTETEKSKVSPHDPLDDNSAPWSTVHQGIADPGGSLLIQLLSQVKVGQSLSAVTLPVHILESRSLLEKLSDVFLFWELLLPLMDPSDTTAMTPTGRLRTMLRWVFAPLVTRPPGAKKPFNPILGEVFACVVRGAEGGASLAFVAEQLSHHPPVSALAATVPGRMDVRGVYHPRSRLVSLNCAGSIGCGSVVATFPRTGYKMEVTWPSAFVSGIVAGSTRLELGGIVRVTDAISGAYAEVNFLRKGWLSGDYDRVTATIFDEGGKAVAPSYHGLWHGTITATDHSEVLWTPRMPQRPTAVDVGVPKQSRRVWKDVTVELRGGRANSATAAKSAVEGQQRIERKQLKEEGREHEPLFFSVDEPITNASAETMTAENLRFKADELLATLQNST